MDSNDKLLKATAEAAGLDSSRAMVKVYMRLKKDIVHQLENKRQKLRLQVAEMEVKVMERRSELNLLSERIRHAEEYVEFQRQYQAQLVRAIEVEMARRNMIVKYYEEAINRLQETWEEYLEIYNRFPLAQRKAALEKEVKLRKFQLRVETQKKEDTTQIFGNIVQMKKLIRESREKNVEALRATIEKDKTTAAELFRIKQEKLKRLARLKAEKDEKEREKQELCEIKSSVVPSGTPLSWATPSTPAPLPQQTYGLAPAISQSSQLPRSQVFSPSSQNTVLMSFNRRIIEERCVVVVSPRPDSTTATSAYSTGMQDSSTVTGQGITFEEPMVVETERTLVDLDYGGSDSSQSSSRDLFPQDTRAAELSQKQGAPSSQHVIVRPTESVNFPQFTAGTSSAAVSYGDIQSQTTLTHQVERDASSKLGTSGTTDSAPASAHAKPTYSEPVIGTSSSRPRIVTPSTKASLAYVMPLPQMWSVSPASTTLRPMKQDFCRESRPTHQNVASSVASPPLTHQNVAFPAAAHRPTLQNAALRTLSPIQQDESTPAPRQTNQTVAFLAAAPLLTHQNVNSPAAVSRPTHQDVALRAPIQLHETAAATRLLHENVASPAAALCPTHQNIASRASSPIQQKGTTAAPRQTHQNAAFTAAASLSSGHSAPSRSQTIVSKAPVLMRELRAFGTSDACSLTTPGSQNAAPNRCLSKSQHPRFHPYMSPRNGTSGKQQNSVTVLVSQPAPGAQSVSQSAPGVRVSVAQNPAVGDRNVISPPVVPGPTAVTVPAQVEPTLLAKTQPNLVTQKSPSPVLMATVTQKTMAATRLQSAMNEVCKLKDYPSEEEKSHYFNQKATVTGTQLEDPEQECLDDFDQVQTSEANSGQGCKTSEGGQEFNPQGYDGFDMDDLTSPPFPKDDVEISPSRVFTSPPSDLGTDETGNAVGGAGAKFGFSSLFGNPFGGSKNAAANDDTPGPANSATPFSFSAAPTTNIFKLF